MLAIVSPYGVLEKIIKKVGVSIWKGKIFQNETQSLTNRIGLMKQYPAHVFCGQSLLDSRRESTILDYNLAEDLSHYNPMIDWQMTRRGLGVRDEIRMVHPGLYLGRAYVRNMFALNFVIERNDVGSDSQA
ncbi:MAG: hypothetical protein H7249_15850 [Chitinophagaceae bacterium]|nr:hypothetical protein [Oligoflexus sp.]